MSNDFAMGLLVGALVMMIIRPFLIQVYRHIRLLVVLRGISKSFTGESRSVAKAKSGEWRND